MATATPPPPPRGIPRARADDVEIPPLAHHRRIEHEKAMQENFGRFFRFGLVDSSLLLVSILAGFSLDSVIARRVGVRGYGPVVGAGVGNLLADTIAGMPEGKYATAGVCAGAAVPLIPLAVAMGTRRPLGGPVTLALGGVSGLLFAGTFAYGLARPDPCEKDDF
jgi:hypothetical protein